MSWDAINVWLVISGAFVHALFVVIGIYIAVNTRLTRLETKIDVLWSRFEKWLNSRAGG